MIEIGAVAQYSTRVCSEGGRGKGGSVNAYIYCSNDVILLFSVYKGEGLSNFRNSFAYVLCGRFHMDKFLHSRDFLDSDWPFLCKDVCLT